VLNATHFEDGVLDNKPKINECFLILTERMFMSVNKSFHNEVIRQLVITGRALV